MEITKVNNYESPSMKNFNAEVTPNSSTAFVLVMAMFLVVVNITVTYNRMKFHIANKWKYPE